MKITSFLGLKTKTDSFDIDDNHSPDLSNFLIGPHYDLKTRPGYEKHNTTAYNGRIQGIFHFTRKFNSEDRKIFCDNSGDIVAE